MKTETEHFVEMELGNMMFGNSRGSFSIDRHSGWEGVWERFCRKMNINHYGWANEGSPLQKTGHGYENEYVWVMPYYWGDCTCGYEDKELTWGAANQHHHDCYQTIMRKAIKPYEGLPYARKERKVDKIRKQLCKKMGLSFPNGCAVHCTCDYEDRWQKFLEETDHLPECPVVLPNFLDKETGFAISWYKYPFRGSYMSDLINVVDFENIIDRIIKITFQ